MSWFNKLMDSQLELDSYFSAEMGSLIGDNTLDTFYDKYKKNMAIYKKTGRTTGLQTQLKHLEVLNQENIVDDSFKENTVPNFVTLNEGENSDNTDSSHLHHGVCNKPLQNINNEINLLSHSKLHRPDNDGMQMVAVVKLERLSDEFTSVAGKMLPPTDIPLKKPQKKKTVIKKEPLENIKRESRTKSKRNTRRSPTKTTSPIRGSEIIIETPEIVIVSVDSVDEKTVDASPKTRPKRTTTQQIKQTVDNVKRLSNQSPNNIKKANKSKQTKHKTFTDEGSGKESESSVYEDAVSAINIQSDTQSQLDKNRKSDKASNKQVRKVRESKKSDINEKLGNEKVDIPTPVNETFQINATMVVKGKKPINETVLIDSAANNTIGFHLKVNETMAVVSKVNETMAVAKKVNEILFVRRNIDDIMTDDESIEEQNARPAKKSKLDKFENSPVKKRVQEFEKLGTQTPVNQTARVTRTKTKKLAMQSDENKEGTQIPVKTPMNINRQITSSNINKPISSDAVGATTLSAMKASLQDFRKREQLRKELEMEAAQKKKSQMEERAKLRAEKELKAKQQRELLEREKLKALQKAKEEKLKQVQLEKQEKLQKQREEYEKKRQLAIHKNEQKKREEEKKRADEEMKKAKQEADRKKAELAQRQKKSGNVKKLPIYMTEKAPRLPTYDCYDSDEERPDTSIKKPKWIHSEYMHASLRTMDFIDVKLKNTLFCPKPESPDLRDIFQNIDPSKLKRNSSAIWNTQPRFTIMPVLSDDDDL